MLPGMSLTQTETNLENLLRYGIKICTRQGGHPALAYIEHSFFVLLMTQMNDYLPSNTEVLFLIYSVARLSDPKIRISW